jgi:orotidine-5'-phosphate decarboxylase
MPTPTAEIIVAIDVASGRQALALAEKLEGRADLFKVGLQLFTAAGPAIVERLCAAGTRVFLDLKYHDIPNTVAGAVLEGCRSGAAIVNLHASGGPAMMTAAAEAARRFSEQSGQPPPLLAAVTVLTSLDDEALNRVGVQRSVEEQVVGLARLAQDCGLGGVVASPREVASIKAACGPGFKVITPGVRPAWSVAGDQRRFTTPAQAVSLGADYLVIGRPITGADDPPAALQRIRDEIAAGV